MAINSKFWQCILAPVFLIIAESNQAHGQDFSSLFSKVDPSVVTIHTKELVGNQRGIQSQRGLGSGVLIDDKGLVMTAAHVVHTADDIQVKFVGGEVVKAQVISSIQGADVALLQVESIPDSASVAKLGDSSKVKIGEQALVIGAPLGVEHSLSVGHISGKATRAIVVGGSALRLIQTDASINRGNSGGPLFNKLGEVIGIVSHILSGSGGGSDGIGFAVAINEAKKILLDGSAFWTGFEGQMLPPEIAAMFNVPQNTGLMVERVDKNSLAGKAGLLGGQTKVKILGRNLWIGGDVILAIQNVKCTKPDCPIIHKSLNSLAPEEKVSLKVLRAGKVIEILVNQ